MRAIRALLAALLFAAASFVTPAGATSFSSDQSDLWWNPNESGWGIQFVQRGAVIFATMFVYDPNGNPIWYTATLTPQARAYTWAGELYVTRGPWFGTGTFNPALVGLRKVGTMNWDAQFIDRGVLTYSVDGVPVTKIIQRQLLVYDNFSGRYRGAFMYGTINCEPTLTTASFADFTVTQNGQTIHAVLVLYDLFGTGRNATLTFDGPLVQHGQFGFVTGTYFSSAGDRGSVTMQEMNVQETALTARAVMVETGRTCEIHGDFSGVRLVD